jgi:hypothetical protein
MTYCFVNPLRWLLGEPTHVAAFANRIVHTGETLVRVYGSAATLEISPSEMGSGGLRLLRGTGGEVFGFEDSENGFRRQAGRSWKPSGVAGPAATARPMPWATCASPKPSGHRSVGR